MSDDLTDRFLNACEDAKVALEVSRGKKFKGLGEALRESGSHPVVSRNKDLLEFLSDLRNAIQHSNRNGGVPIATPRVDVVEAMELLAEQIAGPLPVSKFMTKDPQTVTGSTPLHEAARLIISESLSQLPVVDSEGRHEWLMTTNALARWMGAKFSDDGELVEDAAAVSDVRPLGEDHDVAELVRPTYPASKACNRLTAADAPTALVVTSDGSQAGALQGILTRFDVPEMLTALHVRLRG